MQAHRSLAAPPAAANLRAIVEVQRDLTFATGVITAGAASHGLLDPQQHTDRLRPALTSLEQAWGQLGADLGPMIGRQYRLDPELLLAGNEVRAALRDLTHDHHGFATPATMADRVDLAAATTSLHRGLSAAVDLAHVVRDALDDPELTGAARGAHAMATPSDAPQSLAAWVSAGDLHHDRHVPLPQPARATLLRHAEEIIDKAITADSSSPALTLARSPRREQMVLTGQRNEDRTPPTMGGALTPGIGCER